MEDHGLPTVMQVIYVRKRPMPTFWWVMAWVSVVMLLLGMVGDVWVGHYLVAYLRLTGLGFMAWLMLDSLRAMPILVPASEGWATSPNASVRLYV